MAIGWQLWKRFVGGWMRMAPGRGWLGVKPGVARPMASSVFRYLFALARYGARSGARKSSLFGLYVGIVREREEILTNQLHGWVGKAWGKLF